jgi:DNA uptake protein ComE-like DNA-binding protein
MSSVELDASGYGSLGAFSAIHRPTRRKKILSIIIAVASILLCAALVSVGKSRFLGSSLTQLSSDLPVHETQVKPSISSHSLDAQQSFVENWGNQTPTAMIYARHNPIRDGAVDFYLNFPVGSSTLRAPKWFMGIPLRRKSAKSLRQVELAILQGQINRLPTAKAAASSNRKLLQKKFGSKKASPPSPSARKGNAKGAVSSQSKGSPAKQSFPASLKENCCLPACALGKLPNEFSPKGCSPCSNPAEKKQCERVTVSAACRKLAGNRPIKKGDIVKPLFSTNECLPGSSSSSSGSSPSTPPVPVPSCAIDKSGKFAGCAACLDHRQFPAVDGRICNDQLQKFKPVVGVTVVTRSDKLPDPNPPIPPPALAPPTTSAPSSQSESSSSSSNRPPPKMCSHDPTKLNGNGKGCVTCQGKSIKRAKPDPSKKGFLPGNDYWACRECQSKGICNFDCVLNSVTKVWECPPPGTPSVKEPESRPTPTCSADPKIRWGDSFSNEMQCQGHMCKAAGILPSGEYGPLKYPKSNAYPKKLSAKTCCPFVAQGLTPASCYEKFGCEVPFAIEKGKDTWELSDSVQLCKNFFCRLSVTSPAVWAQKKGDSVFSQGINKGRSACCEKLLASTPDGKESWCPAAAPPVSPIDEITPVIKMSDEECQDFLCMQTPKVSDVGATYAVWREHFFEEEKSEGRRLLAVPSASRSSAASSAKASASSSGSKSHDEQHDPRVNVPVCVNQLQLAGIETWETNEHCAHEEEPEEEEEEEHEEEEHEEEEHEAEEPKGEEHHEEEHSGEAEPEPELEPEELPEAECDEENGPENLHLLPGANVLGYTYDPDFGLEGCNFDRCVIRPFIKFTYKECKVVETPAGMFKVPDQIFAYNLYETSAKTHVYTNEKEKREAQSVEAHVEGSYGPVSAKVSASHSGSSESSSKQHIAVRKIDVHLYRLNLVNKKSFDDLVPEFQEAFKALPPRFEQNVHEYIQFLRDWGRYVPVSGTFGGSVEVIMKFFSASSASKEEMSVGVEVAYASAVVSASGGLNYGKSNEAKEVENNNEISLQSSGGDPEIGAMISDIHAPEQMNFREDLQKWLHSLPKYPRLVEDWPILSVITKFIPNTPGEDGFDPFTRNQGLLDALRILHEDGATSMFDKRKCYPPLPAPDVKELSGPSHIPAPKVRIFEHCNFGGATLALAPGDYDSSYLQNFESGGQNFVKQISSLQIDKGYTVILYSRPGFQGETLVLDKDSSCLVGQNFNDMAQSLKIIKGKEPVAAVGKRTPTLYNGRASLQFNNFDRISVGQCLTFIAETDGDIDVYFFSSPTNQLSAYGFHVKTTGVTFERGLFKNNVVLKKSTDANAAAFGQSSLAQKVWFCMFPDAEDASATVFQYGRDSITLFEYIEKSPVNINYFAMDCSKAATYRSIIIMAASRWLEYTNPYNRVCAIVNCEQVQETESESGTCACKRCAYGYEPYNNNQECVAASQCPAEFGCLAATPPKCICEECCCGLSFDPVSLNCVNANMMIRPGTTIQDNIWVAALESRPSSAPTTPMETKFKTGSSYRIKKIGFACTETNLQNIRVSYDESKPALGFIDYDSTHLVTSSDTAGKFDFSIYDNLRKSVKANPLFSTAGFLNLDEIKLEEVTVKSMIKKAGGFMQDLFKFVGEGAKKFAKDVDATVKQSKEFVDAAVKKGQQFVEETKNKAVEVANDLKQKTQELIKVADEEAKKFMKTAEKVYNDVAKVAQDVTQAAVNLVADNAELLKTLNGIGGAVAGTLVATVPQLLSLTGVWCVNDPLLSHCVSSFRPLLHFFTAPLGAGPSSARWEVQPSPPQLPPLTGSSTWLCHPKHLAKIRWPF